MTESWTSFDGFDWDHGNWTKCQQHGVTIEEIETALRSGALLILPVARRPDSEQRSMAIGMVGSGRHIFVVFTLRQHGSRTLLRPISARYMHQREIAIYDQARARLQNR